MREEESKSPPTSSSDDEPAAPRLAPLVLVALGVTEDGAFGSRRGAEGAAEIVGAGPDDLEPRLVAGDHVRNANGFHSNSLDATARRAAEARKRRSDHEQPLRQHAAKDVALARHIAA